jgi:hypothetical protein
MLTSAPVDFDGVTNAPNVVTHQRGGGGWSRPTPQGYFRLILWTVGWQKAGKSFWCFH